MAKTPDPKPLISPADMQVIESVLGTNSTYALNFLSDHSFNEFIAREVGVDATAPGYSVDGKSKVKRFRRILHSLAGGQQAKLLRALLRYLDDPIRAKRVGKLDDELRSSFNEIVRSLERQADSHYPASAWTGRRTMREQAAIVRDLAPFALNEIEYLASLVEDKRYNDEITADAVQCLRELHKQLGELISAVDRGSLTREAVAAIEANRKKLTHYVKEGAKLTVVAPCMTYGIMHVLSWLTGVPVDSTMVSAVFGAIVGADALKSLSKKSSLAR